MTKIKKSLFNLKNIYLYIKTRLVINCITSREMVKFPLSHISKTWSNHYY